MHDTRERVRATNAKKVNSEDSPRYIQAPNTRFTPEEQAIIDQAIVLLNRAIATGDALTDPDAAAKLFQARLHGYEREVFAVAFLNTRHKILAVEEMFLGTIGGAEVHPREVVKRALTHNAAAIILAHNHPSGDPEPSAADRAVTARLKSALALIDIRLLDHFIIGHGPPVSMAARGWV